MDAKTKLFEKFNKLVNGPMTLDKAILIAVLAHAGAEDKGKNSYIRHVLRVMEKTGRNGNEDEMSVAVCHDVVEDTDITFEDLESLGFTKTQIKTLVALTKIEGEPYSEAIERVKKSYTARKIKVEDIRDNSKLWRLKNRKLSEGDIARMQNYIDALSELGVLHEKD